MYPTLAETPGVIDEAVSGIEVVRRHDDNGALFTECAKARNEDLGRRVVEAGERLIQQHEAGSV
jgi:hypothetical protein